MLAPASFAGSKTWIPLSPQDTNPGFHSVAFIDKMPLPFEYSVLQAQSPEGMLICKSTQDQYCSTGHTFDYNSILKVCENGAESNCISEVNLLDSTGKTTPAIFSKYTVKNHMNSYPGDSKLGIPAGSVPSIWSIPGAPHASGSDYAVIAGMNGRVDFAGNPTVIGSFLQVSLVPVVLKDFGTGVHSLSGGWTAPVDGIYYDACNQFQQTATMKNANCWHVNQEDCFLPTNDQGKCFAEEPFKGSPRINVQLRLAKEPNGWLHGRMVDPNVTIKQDSGGVTTLSVTATTTEVPMVYYGADWGSLSPAVQKYWVDCMQAGDVCGPDIIVHSLDAKPDFWIVGQTLEGQRLLNLNGFPYSFGKIALEGMAGITQLNGNRAGAMTSSWSFRTLSNREMNGANNCFTSTPGIKGLVSTNSTTYSAGPPAFKDGALNYQVASAHFLPDGVTPFKGNYNLVMRSDVARCIYGFSKAPISASISVVSSEGSADVATTVAAEKDGWIALSANNFQFSAPTIQVKFTQEPLASATVAPKPVAKQITITCTKGKISKKVTAIKPTCPKGYVKK